MNGEVFEYAVVRVMPRVERGEAINVGVIVYAKAFGYLCARIVLDQARLGCSRRSSSHEHYPQAGAYR